MTTLTEDTLANPGILADLLRPVRRTDEMDAGLLDAYAAELVRHVPKDREAD